MKLKPLHDRATIKRMSTELPTVPRVFLTSDEGDITDAQLKDLATFAQGIAPEKKLVSSVDIWEPTKGGAFVIRSVPQHLIPRDRPVFRPSPWASMVAASYVRYQCRLHSADSGELIRHSRDAVQPTLIFLPQLSDAAFQEMVAAFKKTKP